MTSPQSALPNEHLELFLCAGEPSGDATGAALARELQRLAPMHLYGVGAAQMREAGVELLYDSTEWSAIGLAPALCRVPSLNVRCVQLRALVCRRRPDLVVLIDFGAFNVRLARAIKRHCPEQPILYYFPPASWSRGGRNLAPVVRVVDYVAAPFPWCEQVYAAHGAQARWVGHPLVDLAEQTPDRSAVRCQLGFPPEATVVGIVPGSRRSEINLILPHVLAGVRMAFAGRPQPRVVVSKALTIPERLIRRHLQASAWPAAPLVEGVNRVFSAADLAVVTMGTATLEGCILGCPMLAVYRGTAVGYAQFSLFRPRVAFLAMPNVIAERRIVPEIIPWRRPAEAVATELRALLEDPATLARMRTDLQAAAAELGPPGASRRAAQAVLDAARGTWGSGPGLAPRAAAARAGVP